MKILVVEDDASLRDSLKELLSKEKYSVKAVSCSAEALSEAKEESFSLIVLDIMLPDTNGFVTLKKIREELRLNTPVLILSAKGEVEDKSYGLDLGADDYLAKPFSIIELLSRIRALLRRNSSQKLSRLKYKNIELDVNERKVFKDGLEVVLTPKEFSIVELLFYNRSMILSATQIAEHLYHGDYFDKSSSVVNMHIYNIRQKLKEADFIETIRGVGFRLKNED